MEKQAIKNLLEGFEDKSNERNGVDFWYARDLQKLLEYTEWRNFMIAINRAKDSCETAGYPSSDHFVDANKMIALGKGGERPVDDIILTRYACYLIAQNGDPRKEVVAFAQTYFAVQTRKQEVLEEQLEQNKRLEVRSKLSETEKKLSSTLYRHGVDSKGFAEIRSKGDNALFGNNSTSKMKGKLGIPSNRPLADFLPTVTLKAKEFAAVITEHNVRDKRMQGKEIIGKEHIANNINVRTALKSSGILPENLPSSEDIKKVGRRINSQTKKLAKSVTVVE